MKVLVTGGYGFIGSFVAERFYQEGCEVSIIDNLSTGTKAGIDFKHKSYILSVEDRKCEEIFRNNRFDVVVHLAAQVNVATSLENPAFDTRSNVLGLASMLALSHKYGVTKFIFASSAAVYGTSDQLPLAESAPCDPISPYGLSKWVGESYCRKWQEMYGLETLCLRFSNVYGPGQGGSGEGGVVSIFMSNALTGKELTVYGDGSQTRDFIYVQDVADAICRASYSSLTGVYNLSANEEKSVNDLIEELRRIHGPVQVSYRDNRNGDIARSVLDHTKLATDLDWAPKYSLGEGLEKTYEWFRDRKPPEEKQEAVKQAVPSWAVVALKAALPYLENALAFAATVWVTMALQNSMYNLFDFKLLYILILGIVYGNRQSIIAVALSTSFYIYEQLESGRELISLLYDTDFFFQVAVYLFIGLIVGYSIERRTRLVSFKQQQLEALEEKHQFLNEVYNETRLVKDELQQQIMNNGDSFGKIYSVTKQLESLEPEKIFASTVSVVESIMKSQSVAIYTVNKYRSYLRLAARSQTDFNAAKSIKVDDFDYLQQVLQEKTMFVNKELRVDLPLLAAPVVSSGEVVAVVSLQRLKFENFTLYYQNLFKVTVDLISSALSRALSYVEATSSQRYLEGTPILKTAVFADIMASKKMSKAKHGIEYVLLKSDSDGAEKTDLPNRISRSLRETDYIGMGEDGKLLVLLSNSSLNEASFVLERFEKNGIVLKIVEDEIRYA